MPPFWGHRRWEALQATFPCLIQRNISRGSLAVRSQLRGCSWILPPVVLISHYCLSFPSTCFMVHHTWRQPSPAGRPGAGAPLPRPRTWLWPQVTWASLQDSSGQGSWLPSEHGLGQRGRPDAAAVAFTKSNLVSGRASPLPNLMGHMHQAWHSVGGGHTRARRGAGDPGSRRGDRLPQAVGPACHCAPSVLGRE